MKRDLRSDLRARAATALAWGAAVAVSAYAGMRSLQFFLFPEPNPATLVWSAHSGYFWRCWTVGYAGCIGAFVAFVVAGRDLERVARSLAPALAVSALLLALQVALFP